MPPDIRHFIEVPREREDPALLAKVEFWIWQENHARQYERPRVPRDALKVSDVPRKHQATSPSPPTRVARSVIIMTVCRFLGAPVIENFRKI